MADRDNVVVADRGAGRGTSFAAWLALFIAVIALWLAWVAYERTGANLDQRIREGIEASAQTVEEGAQNVQDAFQETGPAGADETNLDTTVQPEAITEEQDGTNP